MREIIIYTAPFALYWMLKLCFGKPEKRMNVQPNKSFWWVSFIFFWTSIYGVGHFGIKYPGHIFERDEYYEGVYYVRLYPDNDKVKSCQVLAEITSYKGDYRMNNATMPDGMEVSFYDAVIDLDSYVEVEGEDGTTWGVEFVK